MALVACLLRIGDVLGASNPCVTGRSSCSCVARTGQTCFTAARLAISRSAVLESGTSCSWNEQPLKREYVMFKIGVNLSLRASSVA